MLAAVGWTLLFGLIQPTTRFHFALGPVMAILAGAFFVMAWDGVRAALGRQARERLSGGL